MKYVSILLALAVVCLLAVPAMSVDCKGTGTCDGSNCRGTGVCDGTGPHGTTGHFGTGSCDGSNCRGTGACDGTPDRIRDRTGKVA